MKKVALLDFNNNSNVGNFLVSNDKFCLIGENINKIKRNKIQKILNVDLIDFNIFNSTAIGLFITMDNKNIIVHKDITPKEKKHLEEISKKYKMDLHIINDIENAFGNTICLSKKYLVLSKLHKKSKSFPKLAKKLKKQIILLEDNNFNLAGSLLKANEKGKLFVSQELVEEDLNKIEKDIKELGTINHGSAFVSSGIVVNKFGIILGLDSTTIEIQNVVDNL